VPSETLEQLLINRIRQDGLIDLATYMEECLGHPTLGYYTTRGSVGADGDFTTAPEISQLFGEMIGLWTIDLWQQAGNPNDVVLLELGPGRGTLMADVLRMWQQVCGDTPPVHLVEISPRLREKQHAAISAITNDITWHDTLGTAPQVFTIALANEFFDALPIHQYVKTETGWAERMVDVSASGTLEPSQINCELPDFVAPPTGLSDAKPGEVVEISPACEQAMAQLAAAIRQQGGAALIMDYGYAIAALGDSFQALENGQYADPWANPGKADLTAHVNFENLTAIARDSGLQTSSAAQQGVFLQALGISQRATALKQAASAPQAREIDLAVERLTSPQQMGVLFKVLAVYQDAKLTPAGFAP
jgi:NADH dehydrogenase [ubiquinone] 1 alpha subcomplex assembly factor 7